MSELCRNDLCVFNSGNVQNRNNPISEIYCDIPLQVYCVVVKTELNNNKWFSSYNHLSIASFKNTLTIIKKNTVLISWKESRSVSLCVRQRSSSAHCTRWRSVSASWKGSHPASRCVTSPCNAWRYTHISTYF